MDKRAAKREAHHWVCVLIEGALGNGLLGDLDDNPDDEARIKAAIQELADEHDRKATPR